jgi:hypothetical protein
MKIVIILFISIFSKLAYGCIQNEEELIQPTEQSVFGIKVSKLEKTFKLVTVLSPELLCPQSKVFGVNYDEQATPFKIEYDFNQNGKLDTAFVGTYSDLYGNKGIFLAVVEELGHKNQKVLYVNKEPSRPIISYLNLRNNVLSWPTCYGCDFAVEFEYTKSGFNLVKQNE